MSDTLRITGMVSGMDTDATVKQLIDLEQKKVDKVEAEKQILEWQQEQYREISSMMKSLQSEFLDVTNPSSNLRSSTAFNVFDASSSSDAVTVTTSGGSHKGTISIAEISQLASNDVYLSDESVVGKLQGREMGSLGDILAKVQAGEDTLTFKLDGQTKTIALDPAGYNNYATTDDLVADLNDKLSSAFPSLDIVANESAGAIGFDIMRNGVSEAGHNLSIDSANDDLLVELGFSSKQSNMLNLDSTLADAFDLTGDIALEINGVTDFGIKASDTIDQVMDKINTSNAGVKLTYDAFADSFKLEANEQGVSNTISFNDTSGLLNEFKLNTHIAAQDAVFTINTDNGPIETTRANNSFDYDGSTITLNKTSSEPISVQISANTDDVKEKIVKFVDSYNKIIEHLSKKTTEKRYRDFAPLTSEQKKELEEEDEKLWQDKAKSGLLKNDYVLKTVTSKMRQALYESVEGVGITLKDIGISTSKDYRSGGKLTIDESKLEKALSEKPSEVVKLFTQDSDKSYLETEHTTERYRESGLAERLNDIINDNIRTTNGKGYLIRKAGAEGSIDTHSDIYKKIQQTEDRIDRLMELLADKENKYYQQFARMEAVMQKYSAQSSWLMQQF